MRSISAPYSLAGVDISKYQAGIDIAGYAAEFPLVIIKATEGATITDPYFEHFEANTQTTPYRGFYHFLTHADPAAQAWRFLKALSSRGLLPLKPGDFLINDQEKSGGLEVPDDIAVTFEHIVHEATGTEPWLYSYRSIARRRRNGGFTGPLWLASFDDIATSYELGAIIDQYGVADELQPFYGGNIDVNRVIDPDLLHSLTYPPTTEPEVELSTPITIKSHDAAGNATTDYAANVEQALSFTHDAAERSAARAGAARDNAAAANSKADLILAALANAAPLVNLQTVSDELLLAEVARRFRI